jgi:HAD superfamily hydrolase (TIGR01509 family)
MGSFMASEASLGPFRYSAVLFDMDGVLALNSHFHTLAWQRFAADHLTFKISDEDPRIHGGRNMEVLAALTGRQPTPIEIEECDRLKERYYRDLAKSRIGPTPGLMPYLEWLSETGVPCALVTSAGIENAEFVLSELGLASYFPVRVTAEDVQHGKPHPQPYQEGARCLGVSPTSCLVHEDAPSGVQSALAAGCHVVALTTTVTSTLLTEAGATLLVADFIEWLEQLRSSSGQLQCCSFRCTAGLGLGSGGEEWQPWPVFLLVCRPAFVSAITSAWA